MKDYSSHVMRSLALLASFCVVAIFGLEIAKVVPGVRLVVVIVVALSGLWAVANVFSLIFHLLEKKVVR